MKKPNNLAMWSVEKHCLKCIHGGANYFGNIECWKYNEELDYDTTHNTADREKYASSHSYGSGCIDFEKRSLWWRFKNSTLGFRINYCIWKWRHNETN